MEKKACVCVCVCACDQFSHSCVEALGVISASNRKSVASITMSCSRYLLHPIPILESKYVCVCALVCVWVCVYVCVCGVWE